MLKKPLIEQTIKAIQKEQSKVTFSNLDSAAMKTGVKVSHQALHQPEDLALTPYMANALKVFDNIDDLTVYDKTSKMEL